MIYGGEKNCLRQKVELECADNGVERKVECKEKYIDVISLSPHHINEDRQVRTQPETGLAASPLIVYYNKILL